MKFRMNSLHMMRFRISMYIDQTAFLQKAIDMGDEAARMLMNTYLAQ